MHPDDTDNGGTSLDVASFEGGGRYWLGRAAVARLEATMLRLEAALAVLFFAAIALSLLYLVLVGRKSTALEALCGIDVQLQLRADAIPKVLKIAQRFLGPENKLLMDIATLRTSMTRAYDPAHPAEVQAHLQAAQQLEGKVSQLLATLDNYPQLKSDVLMLQTRQAYADVESHIAAARRLYNAAATDLNTMIEVFPMSLLAHMARIRALPFYRAIESARQPVNAGAYLVR
jgi:LemA protein